MTNTALVVCFVAYIVLNRSGRILYGLVKNKIKNQRRPMVKLVELTVHRNSSLVFVATAHARVATMLSF